MKNPICYPPPKNQHCHGKDWNFHPQETRRAAGRQRNSRTVIAKPGSIWIESYITKEWPIQKDGRYLVEPVEEIGPKGIYFVAYHDGSFDFDRPQNLTRREGVKLVYRFTGECMVNVE